MDVIVHKQFFENRADIMHDLVQTEFWPTTFVSPETPDLPFHSHDVEVHTYVVEGQTSIIDGKTGERIPVSAGDKIVIPAGVPHAEGIVAERVVYIVALPQASNLEPLYDMRPADSPTE